MAGNPWRRACIIAAMVGAVRMASAPVPARGADERCAEAGVLLPWSAARWLWPVAVAWLRVEGAARLLEARARESDSWPRFEARWDGIAAGLPGSALRPDAEPPCAGAGCSDMVARVGLELDVLRVLAHALGGHGGGREDTDLEVARLALLLETARAEPGVFCGRSDSRRVTPRELISLPALGPETPTPERLHVVLPLPDEGDGEDGAAVARLFALHLAPGGPLGRALAAPPQRIVQVWLRRHVTAGVLTLSLDLPRGGRWRDVQREVASVLGGPLPWLGAEALAAGGLTMDDHARLRPLVARALAPAAATFVHVAGRGGSDERRNGPDPERYEQFVLASVTLRCAAATDTRDGMTRLSEGHGLLAEAWRELAREVASDPEVASALEREIQDRCGELAWLRRNLPSERLLALYEGWACRIRGNRDPEVRYRLVRALLERHGLDSAVLAPAVALGRGDPFLATRMGVIDARCPGEVAP